MKNICPVCGYDSLYDPAYQYGGGSLEICPCCGYQYGFTDDDRHISHEEWREKWIHGGMKWNSGKGGRQPAEGWDAKTQLRRIGVFV